MSVYEIRCGTVDYFGRGAIDKLPFIFEKLTSLGMKRVGVVTGRASYKKSGAWDRVAPLLKERGVEYVHYDGISPNPTTVQADAAVRELGSFSPDLLLAIGGGSVIDTTKIIAILLLHPGMKASDLYIKREAPEKALPIIAINLTHGTGSEVDRYAVLTIEENRKKSGAASDAMYPRYAIDDPELMLSLPRREVLFTSLDALNHLIEASTTTLSSHYTRMIAKEGVKIIYECLPEALNSPENIEIREKLLYASILGGIAIDCSVVHLTHPLEHVLSALKPELSHGLGLSLLLPSVVKTIYPAVSNVLSDILAPFVPHLKGVPDENDLVANALRDWMETLGVKPGLEQVGFVETDIPNIMECFMETQGLNGSVSLAPVHVDEHLVERIYRESFYE